MESTEIDIESISSEDETGTVNGEQNCRIIQISEICSEASIWNGLNCLPEAEEIQQLLAKTDDDDDEKSVLNKNPITTLLIGSWMGKVNIVEQLLEQGNSPNIRDENGRTPLHLAAANGNANLLSLLIDYGANIAAEDTLNQTTSLHYASSRGHLNCLKILIEHGADINAGLNRKSPLIYACESLSIDCVRELLANQAQPNTPQIFSETPLHVATNRNCLEIMKLLLDYGAAVNVQSGPEKLTPLHLAAEDGDVECVRLLLNAGAQISIGNRKKQTPLHLAALSQNSITLEELLSTLSTRNNGKLLINSCDIDGRTPLHCAIVKVTRSCECVRLLLNAGAHVNCADNYGYTPLHLAALNELSQCVLLLLNNGGDICARTNGNVSVLTFITRKTPDVIPEYLLKFDNSIRINDHHEIGDVDCELKLDFRILLPQHNKETELLLNFIEVGHREFLKHPLCETFLYLKWIKIRKFFLFSLFYHTLFVTFYTFYIIEVYLKDCPAKKSFINFCTAPKYIEIFGYFLLFFNILLLCKEIFQLIHSWFTYIKQWENWLQWLIIISVFLCVQPTDLSNIRLNIDHWQHHVAAIGIFLSWVELMMIIGRFPIFGLYIQMFTRVAINFLKFLATYFCLLLAFVLSFGVLFANYKSFKDLKWVIIKVLVMMSGELEYEDIFYDDESPIIYNYTAQILFLIYVLLITIILTNLTVGLAVSDIQGLQQSAGLDRLVRQTELIAHLESMLFSTILKCCLPNNCIDFFHKQASLLLKQQYNWLLYIKPNDPREQRIPKDLIQNIYQLVVERKDKSKRNTSNSKRSNCHHHHHHHQQQQQQQQNYNSNKKLNNSPTITRCNSFTNCCNNNNRLQEQIEQLNKDFNEFQKLFKQKIAEINENLK